MTILTQDKYLTVGSTATACAIYDVTVIKAIDDSVLSGNATWITVDSANGNIKVNIDLKGLETVKIKF